MVRPQEASTRYALTDPPPPYRNQHVEAKIGLAAQNTCLFASLLRRWDSIYFVWQRQIARCLVFPSSLFCFLFSFFQVDPSRKHQIFAVIGGAFDPQVEVSLLFKIVLDVYSIFILFYFFREFAAEAHPPKHHPKTPSLPRMY